MEHLKTIFLGWAVFIAFFSLMPGMYTHTKRLFVSLSEGLPDFYEGHAYVNVFAELLRLFGVPEAIIKARFMDRFGLPHFMALLPPYSIVFGVLILGMRLSKGGK